ncbi:unnamed protein product [Orchesella dallaii]|uniref:Death domain-containing protein n=1 Tax=Orchesella dallaii TaxID=48710 RepID=A0ABP1REV6_9HEXA
MASGKRPPETLDESSSGHIGHLVVGDEPCTFVQVRDVLYRCASAGKLWSRLLDIAKSLEIPTDTIISLETRIPTKMTTYPGALLEILEAWRGKFSTEAKLQTLINVLESNGLADCADALWIHFNEHYDAYMVSTLEKLKPTAKSSTWEDLPEHLKRWMNSQLVIFQGNKSKLEELTAQEATPESVETSLSRGNKFYTLLLTKTSDFKMLLNGFSDSNNGAVLSIFVKELINYLYKALMNLEVTGVHHVMHTKGYADFLQGFVQTLEEIDRQAYADKLSIVEFICTLRSQTSPAKRREMYTPLKLVCLSNQDKKLELIQKIITHNVNQSEIQDLVFFCVANTHEHSEVEERKRIITNILQNHPSLYQNQPKYYPTLAPNIHVDLIIHVINLGVNVHATNERKQTLLHLCAGYLKPEEYHRVVNALVEKQETKLFHSRDEDQNTPLHFAVAYLELLDSTIQLFSSAKVALNAVNKYNNTAVHIAVIYKQSERILDSLINAGADENARAQYNRTVLHCAAGSGNLTALEYFLLRGHHINVTDEQGSTPLHLAVGLSKTNTHDMVVLLVEHGADVNAIDENGETPLSIANVSESKVEARTKGFLESIINRDAESSCIKYHIPIIRKKRDKLIALTNFESGLLQKLITGGILTEPELEELGSFETSVTRGNKFYTMLLTRKYDFKILLNAFSDSNNRAVLSIFVKELIIYLYRALMNLEVTGVHHIMNAKGYADLLLRFVETLEEIDRQEYAYKLDVVQLLCTLNPQVLPPQVLRSGMCSPLQLALFFHDKKQLELIQIIIAQQVDVNERDSEGSTPLHYAVEQKPVPPHVIEIVKLLIENGTDPDAVDEQGRTFLHWAPYYLTPELYDELILFFDSSGRKDSPNMRDSHNWSHLHHAVHNFDPLLTTLDIFKSNGIDFNGQDNDGDCVVFDAIEGGRNAEFLRTLFTYGADWRIPNKNQENALHLAALFGNVSALELFIELGCDVNAKNIEGCTPLHNAFLGKSDGEDIMTEHEIVVMLLQERVDVTSKDTHGKTPIDLAKKRLKTGKVKKETVKVLESYSSK